MLGRVINVLRIPLFLVCSIVIIFLGLYFDVPFMIPPFVGSLFILYLERGRWLRRIVGGHIIGLGCAFIEPLIVGQIDLNFIPAVFLKAVIIGIALAVASLIMIITGLKHEPAIATVLLFFEVDRGKDLFLGIVPLVNVLVFLAGLVIVTLMAWMYLKNK